MLFENERIWHTVLRLSVLSNYLFQIGIMRGTVHQFASCMIGLDANKTLCLATLDLADLVSDIAAFFANDLMYVVQLELADVTWRGQDLA